jgi:CHAT domain-containing protein
MTLKPCSGEDAFNEISKIEQSLTVKDSIRTGELIAGQGAKVAVIVEIIKIIEFYLEVTGKKLAKYQIRTLAGDLYDKFKYDTIEDVILLFKMIRTGDLPKVPYTDNLHEKIMSYVPSFLMHKADERDKLIEAKKRKRKLQGSEPITMSQEAYDKFTQLQNLIKSPIKKNAEKFSIKGVLASVDTYLDNLPESCKNLSDGDLNYEIRRTEYNNKTAWEILLQEKERRKVLRKQTRKNDRAKRN